MKLRAGLTLGVVMIAFAACKENAVENDRAIAEAPLSPEQEQPEEEVIPHRDAPESDADPRNFGAGADGLSEAQDAPENTEREEPADDIGPSESHVPVVVPEEAPAEPRGSETESDEALEGEEEEGELPEAPRIDGGIAGFDAGP